MTYIFGGLLTRADGVVQARVTQDRLILRFKRGGSSQNEKISKEREGEIARGPR